VEGADRVQASPRGPFQGPPSFSTELSDQSGLRKGDELLEGVDPQPLQPLDYERIHGEYRDRTGGEKGGELAVRNQNRSSGASPYRCHPGPEFSRSSANPGGRDKGRRKDAKKRLQGNPNLPGRGAVKAFHSVHAQEDSSSPSRLHYGAQPHESLRHFFLGRVVVGRIRFQEGEEGAEGNGLGNKLTRTDSRLRSPLRHLPEGPPNPFSR